MNKIVNPFVKRKDPEYKCFGCSPYNEIGLHLHFFEDGDEVFARWNPNKHFEGYVNVLHGGIQATILDEIASWTVNVKCKTAGVTASLNVKYKKPVFLEAGEIIIRAKLLSQNRKFATIKTAIESLQGEVLAEAEVVYFLFSEKDAREKYNYPGVEAFFE